MRVRHVLTYLSESGAYGGPASVARAQCAGLAAMGEDVDLVAGSDGSVQPQAHRFGAHREIPLRSVKLGRSFAGVITPALAGQLLDGLRDVDLHHVHLSRDLTSLPAALILALLRRPYVIQPHGMISKTDILPFRILDFLATRFVLSHAAAVLALNEAEGKELMALGAKPSQISVVPNGVALPSLSEARAPATEVVFVGRLHPRKRALRLVQAARLVALAGDPILRFTLIGPDEGELPKLKEYIRDNGIAELVSYDGPMTNAQAMNRVQDAAMLVMPSANEPFGLVVLEALAQGTPVIVDQGSGVLEFLGSSESVIIVDGEDPAAIRTGILECLDGHANRQAQAQFAVRSSGLDIESVVTTIRSIYLRSLTVEVSK